jgi:hypothetical protein
MEHPTLGQEDYDPNPVIVPPTWNKTVYHPNLAKVWHRAATELSDAEHIYVSGYSLIGTDTYFRYLFALGAVGASRIRRFVVVDPDETEQFRGRFRGIVGPDVERKLEFIRGQFNQMVSIANDHLLPGQQIR